jgi:hypothetical protein
MPTFGSNRYFFRLISDGDKIVLLRGSGKDRECYLYMNPLLAAFRVNINRPMIECESFGGDRHFFPGLIDYSVDLSFKGGEVKSVDRPLIMGVDIFDKLSITDYLDIINEKIKAR